MPITINTLVPSGLNLVMTLVPSSTVQICRGDPPHRMAEQEAVKPLPISLRNLPSGANSHSLVRGPRKKAKMLPLELGGHTLQFAHVSPEASGRSPARLIARDRGAVLAAVAATCGKAETVLSSRETAAVAARYAFT